MENLTRNMLFRWHGEEEEGPGEELVRERLSAGGNH